MNIPQNATQNEKITSFYSFFITWMVIRGVQGDVKTTYIESILRCLV
jgi:hypothetical protein